MREVDRRHIVLGTAGHVDHGKTSLVQALTGVDCDRLAEEKRRGITIELGFALWDVGGGLTASMIDVPGHERFVGTMVSGATGVDGILLVVSAEDGVMPQTREHLAICTLLGVTCGVVALTKCDVATADVLELIEEDIRTATRGTFLENAAIIRCSARERRGLDALGSAVARAVGPVARRAGMTFLAVDRVFSRAGAGTIVTGTLVRGKIRVGDEVEVLAGPGKAQIHSPACLRVRTMECHGQRVEVAHAATRVALNLRGEDETAIRRGDLVVAPGSVVPARSVHALIELLPWAAPIDRRTRMMLHAGAASVEVAAVLLDRDRLGPGERGLARLATNASLAMFAGQRFVLRRPDCGATATVGGGVIVDPEPLRARPRAPFFFAKPTSSERVHALIREAAWAGIEADAIARRSRIDDDVTTALRDLASARAIVSRESRWFDAALVDETKQAVANVMAEIHRAKPLLRGVAGVEIATRLPMRMRALVRAALDALVASDGIDVVDGVYSVKSAREDVARARVLSRVEERYRSARLAPPLDDVARAELDLTAAAFRDATAELRRAGVLRLVGEHHYDSASLTALREGVARWLDRHATLTPTDFKELCGGITRRHAIPLLEWLDREGVTRRVGDARVAGPKGKSTLTP